MFGKIAKMGCLTFMVIIGIGVVFAIAGGDGEQQTSTAPETQESNETVEEQPQEELPGIGDEVDVNGVTFVINTMGTANSVGGEYGTTAQGTFIILDVSVTNNQDQAITTDTNNFDLLADGKEYSSDGGASAYANPGADFFFQEVNPGLTVEGKVVFDVPEEVASSEDLKVQVAEGMFKTETKVIKLD